MTHPYELRAQERTASSWPRQRSATLALAAVALLLLGTRTLDAQEPIREGGQYRSGVTVAAPVVGVTFRIPEGFQGRMDRETGLFLVSGQGIDAAVWAFSQGSLEDVAEVMVSEIEEVGVVLTPETVDDSRDRELTASFHAISEAGFGRLVGTVRMGDAGNVVGAAALGEGGSDAALEDLVDRVLASVEWSTPEASAWATQLAGNLLEGTSTHTDYSPSTGSGDYGSGASSRESRLRLCSDLSYEWASEGVTIISTAGASARSESRDAHQGAWSLVADLAGNAWLVLEPWDRDELYFDVDVTEDERITLEGRIYSVSAAGC